jgi:hypothetical protein
MPQRKQKRAATPVDATLSEKSPRPSLHHEGLVVIALPKPIRAIREVVIDPDAPAIGAGEIRMMQMWCSDLLRR